MNGSLLLQDSRIQDAAHENEAFLTRQLITYIGNKRALLNFIGTGVEEGSAAAPKA